MAGKRSWVVLAGAGLVWRRQRVLWWIFIVNLLLAFFGTRGMVERAGNILNHSLAAGRLVTGVDLAALAELASRPGAPFASPGTFHFGIVFFIFMLFVTGGILEVYRRDDKLPIGGFFEACGNYFWRFARLLIFLLIALIPIALLGGLVSFLSNVIDEHSVADMMGFRFRVVGIATVLFLLMAVRIWFDMAEVQAVAQNERRMLRIVRSAFLLTRHNFGSLFWLYFRITFLAWASFVLGVWVWAKYVRPEAIGRAFLLSQLIILLWIGTRLWQRASEMLWYQRRAEGAPTGLASSEPPPPAATD